MSCTPTVWKLHSEIHIITIIIKTKQQTYQKTVCPSLNSLSLPLLTRKIEAACLQVSSCPNVILPFTMRNETLIYDIYATNWKHFVSHSTFLPEAQFHFSVSSSFYLLFFSISCTLLYIHTCI